MVMTYTSVSKKNNYGTYIQVIYALIYNSKSNDILYSIIRKEQSNIFDWCAKACRKQAVAATKIYIFTYIYKSVNH